MRSRGVVSALALAIVVVPISTLLLLGGDLTEYLRYETLAGQHPYILSKLFALFAVELVWLQALLGLMRHRLVPAYLISMSHWRRLHQTLGLIAGTTMLTHVVLFVIATSLRNNHPAFDLLIPWGRGVYRTWVAFGAASFWLLAIVIGVPFLRRFPVVFRQWTHRLAVLALVFVALHSLAIGSESRSGLVGWMYWIMGATFVGCLIDRLTFDRAGLATEAA